MRLFSALAVLAFFAAAPLTEAQDLTIGAADLRVSRAAGGGFHLYIRKKPAVNSVLLSESVRDPAMREDNYAYRAAAWNPVNGDERRIVDGEEIPRDSGIWSLIDSTPEQHAEFGEAFHIYIPEVIYYGYTWSRNGEVRVGNGTYFNLRSFALPYADYRGAFRDNSFLLEINESVPAAPENNWAREKIDTFNEIARRGGGDVTGTDNPRDLVPAITALLEKERGKTLDLVIALDTTASMRPFIDVIKDELAAAIYNNLQIFPKLRTGLVLFKDYNELYVTKLLPFTNNFESFQRALMGITTGGGRDVPEAVYEALYDAGSKFRWQGEARLVILIGDAPPHPKPRGRVTKDMAITALNAAGVKASVIILPPDKYPPPPPRNLYRPLISAVQDQTPHIGGGAFAIPRID